MDKPYYKQVKWHPGMLQTPKSSGWLDEHREIAAQTIGRPLTRQEYVHHRDEDRLNNCPENLMVFSSNADHVRHHAGAGAIPNGDGTFRTEPSGPMKRSSKNTPLVACSCGGMKTQGSEKCRDCFNTETRLHIPDKATLAELVWEMPTTQIASMFGVSDVAVGNWCKKYNLQKPPRGYWMKKNAKHASADGAGPGFRSLDDVGSNPTGGAKLTG